MSHHSSSQAVGKSPTQWTEADRFAPDEAHALAEQAEITSSALRAYMAAHIVSDETAARQIRQLLARILQTGRISRKPTACRARSHRADSRGAVAYTFILDPACCRVIGYSGPPTSWLDLVQRIPVDELLQDLDERLAAQRRKEERRAEHERRMQEKEARRAAARAIPEPTWPLLPDGRAYDWHGQAVPVPRPRRPITDETVIRRAGRRPSVVFHADALNSPFFRDVEPEKRHEAIRGVVDKLLRAPSKGEVSVEPGRITVTGSKVTFTLTPDCAMVRTLNPPKPGGLTPPRFKANQWKLPRPRKSE